MSLGVQRLKKGCQEKRLWSYAFVWVLGSCGSGEAESVPLTSGVDNTGAISPDYSSSVSASHLSFQFPHAQQVMGAIVPICAQRIVYAFCIEHAHATKCHEKRQFVTKSPLVVVVLFTFPGEMQFRKGMKAGE
eukprot:1938674-Amphidinium_carterae.1